MPGKKYSANDFLFDERFQQWVKFPTPENEAYWQNFLRLHPGAGPEMEEARSLIAQLDFKVQSRTESTKASIKNKIDNALWEKARWKSSYTGQSHHPSGVKLPPKAWPRIAAAISGLILLAGLYVILTTFGGMTKYVTAYGETKTIVLPDQSVVTLNANSSLRWPAQDWSNTSERMVWLEGEAFFEVQKRKVPQGAPAKFTVHAGDVEVEVLGTAFNVNARHQQTKVVLRSGSVKLNLREDTGHAEKEIMMEPGDLVEVSKAKHKVVKKVVDISHYTAWKENKLIFENTPVAEIVQLIEDIYGLKVSVNDNTLLDRAFTGAAPADDLDILLDKMAVVYHLNIRRNEQKVIIENQ